MILYLTLLSPLNATSDWVTTDIEHQCLFQKSTAPEKESVLRADCLWTLPYDAVLALIEPADRFDEFVSGVSSSERVAASSETIRIVQTYSFPGVQDRAIVLDYTIDEVEHGKRISFTKALDQTLLPKGFVEVIENTGYWEISVHDGKTRLVFESIFNPGGYLPDILFQWFQGPGTRGMIAELKHFVENQS